MVGSSGRGFGASRLEADLPVQASVCYLTFLTEKAEELILVYRRTEALKRVSLYPSPRAHGRWTEEHVGP